MSESMEKTNLSEKKQAEEVAVKKTSPAYRIIKRVFDFVSSFLLGIVILIPLLLIAAIIPIKDFGNPIYRQKRVGKDGKPLYIYKFRSIKNKADDLLLWLTKEQLESYRREYKLDDDPRLIGYRKAGDGARCFGGVLRNTSLDELPQILVKICILGNMSVIGPRDTGVGAS